MANLDILQRDYRDEPEASEEEEDKVTLHTIVETKPKTKVVREYFANVIAKLEDESLREFEEG